MENNLNQGIYNSISDEESIFSDDSRVFYPENHELDDESSDEDDINDDYDDDDTDVDYECESLPDDEEEDNTVYPFNISLLNHVPSIQFIRNQGDQYDISGSLNNNKKTLRLSTVSGNKNKLLTLEIYNPVIVNISDEIDDENPIIKFGMMYPDEFISHSNQLMINRGKYDTQLISHDIDNEQIDYSFPSTNASGYIKYFDWDGLGVEMYSVARHINTNQLIQFANDTITLCNEIDDMVMYITVFPSIEQLFLSIYHEENFINSTNMGSCVNNRNIYNGNKIELKIPFSDIYEILADSTLLLNNTQITIHLMNKMPIVIKKKLNNSNLSIAII